MSDALAHVELIDNSKHTSAHSKKVILVVEDEPETCTVCKLIIEDGGFDVLTASDGREAIQLLKIHRDKIELVLLNLSLPDTTSTETFVQLRLLQPGIPIILTSGYLEKDATVDFRELRLNDFIQKPYLASDLIQKVREHLR